MQDEEPINYEESGELLASGAKTMNPQGMYDLKSMRSGGMNRRADEYPAYFIKEIENQITERAEGKMTHRHIWKIEKGRKSCKIKGCFEVRQRR
jgi:hypothetical protein